jgi:Proteins containing SET domain
MTKEELLEELTRHTFATLKPSPIHGIGVFALREIPKGCRNIFSKDQGNWIKLPIRDVENLPDHSRSLVETYCLYDDENYFVPDYGFKIMDLVNYLNHSPNPNLISVNDGEYYEAIRNIKPGEELLINYNEVVKAEGYDEGD